MTVSDGNLLLHSNMFLTVKSDLELPQTDAFSDTSIQYVVLRDLTYSAANFQYFLAMLAQGILASHQKLVEKLSGIWMM